MQKEAQLSIECIEMNILFRSLTFLLKISFFYWSYVLTFFLILISNWFKFLLDLYMKMHTCKHRQHSLSQVFSSVFHGHSMLQWHCCYLASLPLCYVALGEATLSFMLIYDKPPHLRLFAFFYSLTHSLSLSLCLSVCLPLSLFLPAVVIQSFILIIWFIWWKQ